MTYQSLDADVIIIGAGIAGMITAHVLTQKEPSLSIMILESNDKIGGRAVSISNDIGGQWISSQQKILLNLLDKLEIKTETKHDDKRKTIIELNRKIYKYSKHNALNFCSSIDRLRLGSFITKIETLCQEDSLDPILASMTMEEYINKNVSSLNIQSLIKFTILSYCGIEASHLSVGFYIFFCISTHGIANQLMSATNGLRQFWIQEGVQQICDKIATSFDSYNVTVMCDTKVVAINDQRFQLEVKTGRSSF